MHIDASALRELVAGPGTDTRAWVAYAQVMPDQEGQRSVTFDDDGPHVLVKFLPSGIVHQCAVVMQTCGDGEAEWHPFVAGEEVIVEFPDGVESSGPLITGRKSNIHDRFPRMVAGNDVTQNNFGFKRTRAPYVFEGESSYLVRAATALGDAHAPFLAFTDAGAFTVANTDKALLQLGADVLGFRNGDADCLVEVHVADKRVHVEAGSSKLQLASDGSQSMLLAAGPLAISGSGVQPVGHAVTIEQVLVLLQAMFTSLGFAVAGPITGFTAAGLLVQMNAAIAAANAISIAPLQGALTKALATPTTAVLPGVGSPGVTIG